MQALMRVMSIRSVMFPRSTAYCCVTYTAYLLLLMALLHTTCVPKQTERKVCKTSLLSCFACTVSDNNVFVQWVENCSRFSGDLAV